MSREQLFICAMETREKQLLAQELYKRNGRCDAVRYEEGAIIIENETVDVDGDLMDTDVGQGNNEGRNWTVSNMQRERESISFSVLLHPRLTGAAGEATHSPL